MSQKWTPDLSVLAGFSVTYSLEERSGQQELQRLKRVFNIETCERCGGQVKVVASIKDPAEIAYIIKRSPRSPRQWLQILHRFSRAVRVMPKQTNTCSIFT